MHKTAIITGAGRGIGAAIAKRLAAEGTFVAINYSRSANEAESLVEEIQSNGGRALAVQADISEPRGVQELFAAADKAFKEQLDSLVNNAGVFPLGELGDCTEEDFENAVNLNVRGTFLAACEATKRMKAGSRIINIGSILVNACPYPAWAFTPMSKFAVTGFTQT